MTRKDYNAFAAAIRAELDMRAELTPTEAASDAYYGMTRGIERAVEVMATVMAADNPRFDRARFLAAALPQA